MQGCEYEQLAAALNDVLVKERARASRREAELELRIHDLRGQLEERELEIEDLRKRHGRGA